MEWELAERLTRIEDKLDKLIPDHERVKEHHVTLYGEGKENPGLVLRIDRMTTEVQYWHWGLGILISATSIPLGERIWHLLTAWLS